MGSQLASGALSRAVRASGSPGRRRAGSIQPDEQPRDLWKKPRGWRDVSLEELARRFLRNSEQRVPPRRGWLLAPGVTGLQQRAAALPKTRR